ncbi:MAG TPA: GNAT family N-acetyltransferase [Thermoleophilaceae bacterium]
MFSINPSPLTTERLALEPLRVEHAAEMVDVLADPSTYEYIGGEPPSEAELAARYLRQTGGRSPDGRQVWLNWVARRREDGDAIGTVQATVSEDGSAELAWVISTSAQGNGYATEGTSAVIAWLRDQGITAFVAHIHPEHSASVRVARRLGFERKNCVKDGELRWERE